VRSATDRVEVVSRYCHMLVRPLVRVGQVVNVGEPIGIVGTSGNSSGPHLHLEIHLGHDADGSNAISPVEWFRAQGVTLGSDK
jgi:murein DD-endopeptidase MepM/ murein hydrolase activator NlpD